MTTGTWEPQNTSASYDEQLINSQLLQRIISLMSENTGSTVDSFFTRDEQKKYQGIMTSPQQHWEQAIQDFSTDDIVLLIKFFTLAEKDIMGWEAEDKSPVIWLVKILKKKGQAIDKNLRLWIKSNSHNKFLPYGPL